MSTPDPAIIQTMQRASALLQAGNFVAARSLLEHVAQAAPGFVEAYRLLAGALLGLRDVAGAERVLREAVAIDPNWGPAQTSLGEMLIETGRLEEGEQALRRAIRGQHGYPHGVLALASLLNRTGRTEGVLELLATYATAAQFDPAILNEYAGALIKSQRYDEAVVAYRRIVSALPNNPMAELNLAGALEASRQFPDAANSAQRAMSKGAGQVPEAHYTRARALIGLKRFDEAEAALRAAIKLRPLFADAHGNLAQLIWMRSGDFSAACEALDRSLNQQPDDEALHILKSNLLEANDDAKGAHAWLAERANRPDVGADLLLTAANVALKFDARLALQYAERASQLAPTDMQAAMALIDAQLGSGDAPAALRLADKWLQAAPDDQRLIAAQTTAWRLSGDPRYAVWCDYERMARAYTLDTPSGWNSLDAYLRDLSSSLRTLHSGLFTHPLYQSERHGSKTTQNLLQSDDPPIRAFFAAIDGPIKRHIETIGHGPDPLRRRNTGAYRMRGVWSVRLRGGGYHVNHCHPEGWLSSACYIELPSSMSSASGSKEGWLKFGEPCHATLPPLAPEHYIRPEPGLLALFPSYFWHGTVPFAGDDTRLTIAFDLVPA